MGILKEFREFAIKGNVVDLAIGVIIGAAFGKIVSSLVSDIIMPPLGLFLAGLDFKDLSVTLKPSLGRDLPAVVVRYGLFIQTLVDFLIIATVIFLLIKGINAIRARLIAENEAAAPTPPRQEQLLEEIRDQLKTLNEKKI